MRTAPWILAALLAVLGGSRPTVQAQSGRQFYAAPAGLSTNPGTIDQPLALATALSATSPLRAGDTLWLRGGRYVGNFTSSLTGTPAAPIVVRQYIGERATLDAATTNRAAPALTVNGADTWYWGFEVTDTDPARVNANGYNNPPLRATSVDVYGPRTRFINMIVHDGLQGFGFWSPAIDSEIYGSVIYNVGVEATDRGHGHSIYVQNQTGWKRIVDNIMFHGFSFGIHAYTQNGRVDNIHIEGNTLFGHGLLSARSGAKANVVTGGGDVADFTKVLNNYSYYGPLDGRGLDLDYGAGCQSPDIRGNYSVAEVPVKVAACTGVTMTSNTFYGYNGSLPSQYPANTYHAARPTGVRTFVRPNAYEPGRANVTIFNWDVQPTVSVDISSANLAMGARFEVRDAQNFFGPPVASGVYAGTPIAIPMTNLVAVPPIGNAPVVLPHTAPQFGAFVLLPLPAETSPGPNPPPPNPTPTPTPPPTTPPRIDSLAPSAGPSAGGTVVTITGAGFGAATTVRFGDTPAAGVVVLSTSTLSVTVPTRQPGAVDVSVATGGQSASRTSAFTFQVTPPVLRTPVVNGRQVSLRWDAGAGTPVQRFHLVGGSTPGGREYGMFAMGQSLGAATSVAPGRYYARVAAETDWGTVVSNEVAFGVEVPESQAAVLSPATIAGTSVTLAWTNASGSPTAYLLVARAMPTGSPVATLPVTGTRLTVSAPRGTYYVTVVALYPQGPGPESNQIAVVVP